MIETIRYDDYVSVIVFDEPIPEYHDIMLEAASDEDNTLIKNYTKDLLKTHHFMTIWTFNAEPAIIYGLHKDPDLPSDTCRAMSRIYRRKNFRDITKQEDLQIDLKQEIQKRLDLDRTMYFYFDHPQFHQEFGINNMFLTRNVTQRNDQSRLEKHFDRYRKMRSDLTDHFIYEETVRIYHTVPQRFWVWGDNSFLNSLPVYQPDNPTA